MPLAWAHSLYWQQHDTGPVVTYDGGYPPWQAAVLTSACVLLMVLLW